MDNSGYGMQIVKVTRDNNQKEVFELNVTELNSLLLREDVAGKPVTVVSIAGPFRGGKSFLLDFFLRYLSAPKSKQQNGDWLGGENEPLRGFHWRGGCDGDTVGIHLWSQPFHIKLEPSGEEVVVLLMDTQGTFDSNSSLRDSTRIFALSTLTSSKQLYNLNRNIDESDLQHLHLFTDYGRKTGGKAFQELQFLVRDWMNAHQYPYGYEGGQRFLADKLKIANDQHNEVTEVRKHIHECFEKVTCFLMPHPGLQVGEIDFNGSLSDIDKKFKASLLNLVPSLFGPTKLQPKIIGGQKVKAQDLRWYLEQYVKTFNQDSLPPITSIVKGTAAAGIMAATNAARQEYDAQMKMLDDDNVSFSSNTILAKHEKARAAAIQLFNGRTLIGSKHDAEKALKQLIKDLDHFLRAYQYNNEIKVRSGSEATKSVYNTTLHELCGVQHVQQVCVHPVDFDQFHSKAMTTAFTKFDSLRKMEGNEVDPQRARLHQKLATAYLERLCTLNENNNQKAVEESHTLYLTRMNGQEGYVNPDELKTQHEEALAAAKAQFAAMRTKATQQETDSHEDNLIERINVDFRDIKLRNFNPNKTTVQLALQKYNELIEMLWIPSNACFHPEAFNATHDQGKRLAVQKFQRDSIEHEKELYLQDLETKLQRRYTELNETNDFNNRQAVESALAEYIQNMDKFKAPRNFIADFFRNFKLSSEHKRWQAAAELAFRNHRLGRTFPNDPYVDDLLQRIDNMYETTYKSFWSTVGDILSSFKFW